MHLRFLAIAMWCENGAAASDISILRYINEGKKLAVDADEQEWCMHFDWLAWRRGHPELALDTLRQIGEISDEQRIFLLILLSYNDSTLIVSSLEPLLMANNSSNSTLLMLAGLVCLGERVERGEANEARLIYNLCMETVPKITEKLPGMLVLDPSILRNCWTKLVSIMSLRAGEAPTDIIKELIPDQQSRFSSLSGSSKTRSLSSSPYNVALSRLLDMLKRSIDDPCTVLKDCCEVITDCPQLESLRLIVHAVSAYFAKEPIHHIKGDLLESLKLLNGTTQNVLLKVIVLLLVGRLYLETDFEMSIKMNQAAYNFASTAQWDLLGHLAAKNLSVAYRKLGKRKEAEHYARLSGPRSIENTLT